MKVLYHIPYVDGLGADRWICDGWREGFRALGHEFHTLPTTRDLLTAARTIRPQIFFTAINIINLPKTSQILQRARDEGTRVALWVHWPLESGIDPASAEILTKDDVADLYFGEREAEQMQRFERETGKKYHTIPHAANPRYHFPTSSSERYRYDVVYLGANLRKKRWFTQNVLSRLRRRYRVAVFGPQWTTRDRYLGAGSHGARRLGLYGAARLIDRARITIPESEENTLYSSATIALNFHEREDDGSQPHYIVNQRTFKIPACGGFQLCDHVPAVTKYFRQDEIVVASLDANEWLEKIDYYLRNRSEREDIRRRGMDRAHAEHLYTHRVKQVLALLGWGP